MEAMYVLLESKAGKCSIGKHFGPVVVLSITCLRVNKDFSKL